VGIIYTSVVLVAGFCLFAFSRFGGIQALGMLTTITLLTAMLTNLLVLPAMVLSLNKRILTKAFREPLLEIHGRGGRHRHAGPELGGLAPDHAAPRTSTPDTRIDA
jgi:uncharacterized membrane protein YdfJ with MMPL/SSD domain